MVKEDDRCEPVGSRVEGRIAFGRTRECTNLNLEPRGFGSAFSLLNVGDCWKV